MNPRHRSRGFTAIELLVTMSMLGIMMALAMPSFNQWIVNTRIRTAAEALQNSLRLAQAEAVRRNRQVVFALTNVDPALNANAAANARNWLIQTVAPAGSGETPIYVQGGSFADGQQGVTVTGAASTCFNSTGRLVANPTPGVGVACTLTASTTPAECTGVATTLPAYGVTSTGTGSYHPLCVTVAIGGQVRMCDPARSKATSADGC